MTTFMCDLKCGWAKNADAIVQYGSDTRHADPPVFQEPLSARRRPPDFCVLLPPVSLWQLCILSRCRTVKNSQYVIVILADLPPSRDYGRDEGERLLRLCSTY